MNNALARTSLLACLLLLAIPAAASAAPTPWAGTSFNDLGPASTLLSVTQDGRAAVTNVQLILACTDAEDGTESERAFDARYRTRQPLRRNRFSFDFSALSGGRLGRVRLNGILRSNGRGAARVRVEATATGEGGEVVERCQGATRIPLSRPSGWPPRRAPTGVRPCGDGRGDRRPCGPARALASRGIGRAHGRPKSCCRRPTSSATRAR